MEKGGAKVLTRGGGGGDGHRRDKRVTEQAEGAEGAMLPWLVGHIDLAHLIAEKKKRPKLSA